VYAPFSHLRVFAELLIVLPDDSLLWGFEQRLSIVAKAVHAPVIHDVVSALRYATTDSTLGVRARDRRIRTRPSNAEHSGDPDQ
jgi:hypothetical protein